MARISRDASSVNERLAEHLVIEGLRAPIVKQMTSVPATTVSEFYRRHHGRNSPSGQLPADLKWFAEDATASLHGAYLVLSYLQIYDEVKKSALSTTSRDGIVAMAFGRTLSLYRNNACGGESYVSPERAHLIIKHFHDRTVWARNASSATGIKLATCSRCRLPMIVKSHYRDVTCTCCQKDATNTRLN